MRIRIKFAMLTLFLTLATSVVIASPASAASHWTKQQAGKHYLHYVAPANKELAIWTKLAQGRHTLRAFTNQAGYVAQSTNKLNRRLIIGRWPRGAEKSIQKFEVRLLHEEGAWENVANSRTIHQFHRATALLPKGSKAANRVRKALGLPSAS